MNPTIFNVRVMTRTAFSVRQQLKRGIVTFLQRRRLRLLKSAPVPSTLCAYALPPGHQYFCRPRPFSVGMSDGPSIPTSSPDQVGGGPKGRWWPEEDFASTADQGGGFYPVRLGETFDDGRFVVTRKLGWGGFSSVWLARDCKYVPKTDDFPLTNG